MYSYLTSKDFRLIYYSGLPSNIVITQKGLREKVEKP